MIAREEKGLRHEKRHAATGVTRGWDGEQVGRERYAVVALDASLDLAGVGTDVPRVHDARAPEAARVPGVIRHVVPMREEHRLDAADGLDALREAQPVRPLENMRRQDAARLAVDARIVKEVVSASVLAQASRKPRHERRVARQPHGVATFPGRSLWHRMKSGSLDPAAAGDYSRESARGVARQ